MRQFLPQVIRRLRGLALLALLVAMPIRAADSALPPAGSWPPSPVVAYADLVDLAEAADSIARVEIRKALPLEPQRAGPVPQGYARLYLEARVQSALTGDLPALASIRFLANVKLDSSGKLPALNKKIMLVIARKGGISADGKLRDLQLIAPDAHFIWDAALESRMANVIAQLRSGDAPPVVKSVREAIYVPGTLAGEGETQLFLATADGAPASITIVHKPKSPVNWSVSFSEVMDSAGIPPLRDTLAWYRLACFLPRNLPNTSNLSDGAENRNQAAKDYRMVIDSLGLCGRLRAFSN